MLRSWLQPWGSCARFARVTLIAIVRIQNRPLSPVYTGQPIMMTPQSRLQIAMSKHLLFFFLTRFQCEYANPTARLSGKHVIVYYTPRNLTEIFELESGFHDSLLLLNLLQMHWP